MNVDATINKVRISFDKRELKPQHRSQLSFWGFISTEAGVLQLSQDDISETLIKVIQYFKSFKLSFTLSTSAENLIEKYEENKNLFANQFNQAKKFKDGEYDETVFKKYSFFLEKHIYRNLKDHQIKAFYHLALLGNGANFSVPGSGKTSVVLAHYEMLRQEGKVNALFVVGPAASFGPWRYEFKAVLNRTPKYKILAGQDKAQRQNEYYRMGKFPELYLTSFQTLLNDKQLVPKLFRNKFIKAYFVVDEAHYMKQINGQWANAVLETSKYAKNRCALTGTPIPRSYSDIFNIFDFLWPEQNLLSPNDKAHLLSLEEQNNNKDAQGLLENKIGPLFYRVRKSELSLKPQIFHNPIPVEMNPVEREIYDAIISKIRNYSEQDYLLNIDTVRRLRRGRMIRLRQNLSYSDLLKTAIDGYDEEDNKLIGNRHNLSRLISNYDRLETPAKLEELLKLVKKINKDKGKVVIWAHFIGTVNLIEKALLKENLPSKKIIGSIPVEKESFEGIETREKIIAEFNDPNSQLDILIANPAACAESISLHKTCHHAVYYDLSYNGAQYLQSLDRIHRVGGSETVEAHYHYLQYANTIDGKILENLNQKAQKMYDIINGDYNIYSLDMFESDDDSDSEAYNAIFGEYKNEV